MKQREKKPGARPGSDHGPVTHYVIGKGISKMPMVSVDFTRPDLTVEDLDRVLPKGTYTFEGRVAFAEKWAIRVLGDAGLPTDPGGYFGIPDGLSLPLDRPAERIPGRTGAGDLLSFVEAKGKKIREDTEWYAARILGELHLVRTLIERGETAHAAHRALDLGILLQELHDVMLHNRKVLKWEGWQDSGSVGGSKEKKIAPVQEWACETVKTYPDKPEPFYWGSLPSYAEGDSPELINGVEMIRDGKTLIVIYPDGRSRTLARRSFPRYINFAKKSLKK